MSNRGLIVYSSISGNTKLLADKIHKANRENAELYSIEKAPDPDDYDWFL